MYPIFRTMAVFARARRAPKLDVLGTDEIALRCWPIDIDMFMELNNGRTLTLYDLGRFSLSIRVGLIAVLRRKGWGLAVAGASVRFRRRVRMFQKLRMRTRAVAWDGRFIYIEQAIWRGATPCSHILLRTAVTGTDGIVPPAEVLAELAPGTVSPPLPGWAAAWAEADNARPWPPEL